MQKPKESLKNSFTLEEELAKNRKVFCQGKPQSPHPKVYLFIAENKISCPYCSKTFIYKGKN